jgi:hypothetical protein
MSEGKVKEIKEFVEDFNKKLRKSFQLYELKNAKAKKLKKNFSQVNERIKMKNLLLKKNEENKCCPKTDNLINKKPLWKPPNGPSKYFEKFKRLRDEYELNPWEKVSK